MDSYSESGVNEEVKVDKGESVLPGYVPYLSLAFKLIATTINLMLSSWVVYTIKTTRSLHKPHNIFVANLLVSGMIATLTGCVIASTMMISFQMGVESFDCTAFKLYYIPFHVNIISFVIIAADKVLAITFPFKHKRMMTLRVVTAVITGAWLLALIPTTLAIILDVDGYYQVAKYGICFAEGAALVEGLMIYVIPSIVAPVFTVTLNIYLAIKAYRIHQQTEKETRLAGITVNNQSEGITTLEKKRKSIMRHKKPIITLLVVVLGSVSINFLFPLLYTLGRVFIASQVYHYINDLVITRNVTYLVRFFHPLVYGLYFKEIRKPMIRYLKRCIKMKKVNSVAPRL